MPKKQKVELAPLSRSQRELMEIVWDKGEVAAFEVTEIVNQTKAVARTTISTTLDRMEKKGWLSHRAIGRTHFYSATVPQEENLGQRVKQMIDSACGGKPEKLMLALLEYRGLSDDEHKQIQKMLRDAKKKK